ncbi:Yox1p [Paramicrosporidium saccamoebae]|uniref:Yox1p n=1 Tax=Paramicrosporidium saccamoebae TaxID=1246581 RepID=A0A2H9TJC6_9FUNG|nr:Yox1p [Paramicrosporidium saccamoebae]
MGFLTNAEIYDTCSNCNPDACCNSDTRSYCHPDTNSTIPQPLNLPPPSSPHLTSPHLTSPHLTSPHLISPHLTSPRLLQIKPECYLKRPNCQPLPNIGHYINRLSNLRTPPSDRLTRKQPRSSKVPTGDRERQRAGSMSAINATAPPGSTTTHLDLTCVGYPANIERMFETFHQSPHGDFKPTFYNPFEIKHRRRTTKAQFRVLETAFQENNKPNASSRRALAAKLGMTPRAVQVWFQNRRAKNKTGKGPSESSSPSMSIHTMEDPSQSQCQSHCQEQCNSQSHINPHIHSQKMRSQCRQSPGLGRRHSMPDMQPNLQAMLPFRELHEAIFGKCMSRLNFANDQKPRKNSGCSINFLNSFLNLGLTPEQYSAPPSTLYDPMISGDSARSSQDLATPSISAPGSSPSLPTEELFHLRNQPNAAAVEAMAARLSSTLSPAELDLLIQNVAPKMDYYPSADLAALLFPGEAVSPMELMGQEFLFAQPFQEEGQF